MSKGIVMFGRRSQSNFTRVDPARGWWPQSDRGRRRERERAAAERMGDLRWRWRSACAATPLAPMIYTPSGVTRAAPVIDHIELGPPVTLTVRMRLGQTVDDFVAAAPKIAPAFDVAAIEVTPLVQQWVRLILVPNPLVALPDRSHEPHREAMNSGPSLVAG
jgi:hypothetical protein